MIGTCLENDRGIAASPPRRIPDHMKIAGAILLFIIVVFVGLRAYSFLSEEKALQKELSTIEARLTQSQADEADLQAETQYLANPANLEKELRAHFNYKKPGETMIIIVSPQSSTATSTP